MLFRKQNKRTMQRLMICTVYGNNSSELERKALAVARDCFGVYAELTIIPDYQVNTNGGIIQPGKKYTTTIQIEIH